MCHIETTAVMKSNQRDLWLKFAKRNPFSSLCMEHTILKMFFMCLINIHVDINFDHLCLTKVFSRNTKETALEKIQSLLKDKKDNVGKQS